MSQRFTVSKSDGDRRPSDIQGEVNQLFEGDEPTTSSGAEGDDAAGTEVVVVLKVDGLQSLLCGSLLYPTAQFQQPSNPAKQQSSGIRGPLWFNPVTNSPD